MIPIGKLSEATGVKVPTIRYYEQIGILPEPERSAANQRLYDYKTQERLSFIRHARELGFPLEDIRELLSMVDEPHQSCLNVDKIARRQLAATTARISRLLALQQELERMLAQCSCGTVANCRVIEVLSNHDLCRHDHGSERTD